MTNLEAARLTDRLKREAPEHVKTTIHRRRDGECTVSIYTTATQSSSKEGWHLMVITPADLGELREVLDVLP